jgi:CubicO group peptidase (beta-lactamase class C family)
MAMRRRAETVPRDQLHGWVAPGFEPVQQTFADNFAQRGELGAACAVYRHGEPVVDLWGGLRDRGLPRRQDTLVLVFSVTKGMTATALAVAHARGLLDYDTPVAAYWPEFAEAGKQAITVRQVLAHQAGLATIDQRLRLVDLANQDRLAALIARQAAPVAARDPPGLPLPHRRVDRRRADQAHRSRRAHPRALLRRRGRRPPRSGVPHRAATRRAR